jgi:hypothetical protein
MIGTPTAMVLVGYYIGQPQVGWGTAVLWSLIGLTVATIRTVIDLVKR